MTSMLLPPGLFHPVQVFGRFDGDGSGRISRVELLDLVGKHGPGFTSELDEEVGRLLLLLLHCLA
jgi:Ca2+-binding EF-hand superfamily protein